MASLFADCERHRGGDNLFVLGLEISQGRREEIPILLDQISREATCRGFGGV